MDNLNIKLFNNDSSQVTLPQVSEQKVAEQSSLKSQSIESAISGTKVKTIILPEEAVIDEHNFIFDFSEMETISVFQREAIKSLISTDGDTSLYLYKKNSLVKIGCGDKYTLERMIPIVRAHVFDNGIRVFKDFGDSKPVQEVEGRDITQLRLNL